MDTQSRGHQGCDGPRSDAKLDSFFTVASIHISLPSELEIPLQEHVCTVWGGSKGSWKDKHFWLSQYCGNLDADQRELDLRLLLFYLGASWKYINGLVTRSANLEEQFIPRAWFFPHLSSVFLCCNLLGRWGELGGNMRRSTGKASHTVRVKCEHPCLGLLILGLQVSHWAFLDLSYLHYLCGKNANTHLGKLIPRKGKLVPRR